MAEAATGLIGLGVIGQLYARHLIRARGTLAVHDVLPERVSAAVGLGAVAPGSARAVAETSDVVVVALPNPAAVEAAFRGPDGLLAGLRPGSLIIDVSTVDPDTSRSMYAAARERDADYLDAPVSGGAPGGAGTDGARAATISFMVGGDRDAFERAQPTMAVLGKRWFYLGPAGSGSTVKLISNLVAGLHNLVASEAFVLGAAAGFAPDTLLEVFDGTDAKSFWLTDYFAPRIRRRDFEPGFSVDLQYKDHRLASDLGRRLGVPLFLNDLAVALYQAMRANGLGGRDLVESVRFLGGLAGADIYEPRTADE
ncbi:MAG TPA: NAD(P)-dependent oxidoreductase [Candidatus Limnocylindrales bacterium]|nr:NAD(P)-dependent oxidoreductase [Candidatus Limnocylindrales bacterium]